MTAVLSASQHLSVSVVAAFLSAQSGGRPSAAMTVSASSPEAHAKSPCGASSAKAKNGAAAARLSLRATTWAAYYARAEAEQR